MAVGPGRIAAVENEIESNPAPGTLLVRAASTLISAGTELAKIAGATRHSAGKGDDWSANPLPLGYSFAGVVEAVGQDAGAFKPGDRVSAHAPHVSFAMVDAAKAAILPDRVSLEDGTFGTLGPIALNGIRLGRVALGESCAIIGFGLLGQLAALFARLAGARPVAVLERRATRRRLAVDLGFQSVDPADENWDRRLFALAGRDGYDVVIEAAGSPSSFLAATRIAGRGGRVVLLGSPRERIDGFDLYDVHFKGVTIVGAHASTQARLETIRDRWTEAADRRLALSLIASGALPVKQLISHRIPSEAAPEAFAMLRRKEPNAIVLEWS